MVQMASVEANGGTELLEVVGVTERYEEPNDIEADIKTTIESSDGSISEERVDTITVYPRTSRELKIIFSLAGIEGDKNITACMEVQDTYVG